jgi:Asp-tRNA(Asn)/Glu-tRNA(Gln) amidotransferase A subunit family amidase
LRLAESVDTVGGFARSVADVAWLVTAMTCDDGLRTIDTPLQPQSVGWFAGPHWSSVDGATQLVWQQVIDRLATLLPGSSALPVPVWFEMLHALQSDVMLHEAAHSLAHERLNHGPQLSPRLGSMLQQGLTITGAAHVANLAAVQRQRLQATSLFEQHTLLIAPSAVGQAGPVADGTSDPLVCRA